MSKVIVKGTKYRSLCNNVQLRAVKDEDGSEKMKFEGYAIVFNQETTLYKAILRYLFSSLLNSSSESASYWYL